jgi:hypothetical protein
MRWDTTGFVRRNELNRALYLNKRNALILESKKNVRERFARLAADALDRDCVSSGSASRCARQQAAKNAATRF